jgi:SDR family mycofactocin-dependent oxidoreductase
MASSQRFAGKVALVTGAAQGQGRAHAVRFAQEGADVIVTDIGGVEETAAAVAATGRRFFARDADVRDAAALRAVVDAGVEELGGLDAVVANAGVIKVTPTLDDDADEIWKRTIDVNLTGTWNTCRATLPHLVARGGGAIVIAGSTQAVRPTSMVSAYAASKHGLVGLVKTLGLEFAEHRVRVNIVHPTTVRTPMLSSLAPDLSEQEQAELFDYVNALPVPWVEPEDVSEAILFLASDAARYVTGAQLPVDAGALLCGPRPSDAR